MSNIISAELKPQAPQAAPDGNAIASLILGILGVTMLPFIGGILAVIFGHISTRDAYRRGERGSAIATAGVILGWIGVAAFTVLAVFFGIFTVMPWWITLAVVILGASAWVIYYTRRNDRR